MVGRALSCLYLPAVDNLSMSWTNRRRLLRRGDMHSVSPAEALASLGLRLNSSSAFFSSVQVQNSLLASSTIRLSPLSSPASSSPSLGAAAQPPRYFPCSIGRKRDARSPFASPPRRYLSGQSSSPSSSATVVSSPSAVARAGAAAQSILSSVLAGLRGGSGAAFLGRPESGTKVFSPEALGNMKADLGGAICRAADSFRFRNLRDETVERVIKAGTLARTLWPVFLPIFLYQYIRQTDEELFNCELLYLQSSSTNPSSFYDASKAGWGGHWRIQQDLALIHYTANPEEAEKAATTTESSKREYQQL